MANSAGIKIEIEERLLIDSQKLSAVVKWLEANQPDVFRRGLWDAIAQPVQPEPAVNAELLEALKEIAGGTYDTWSEGYRAQQIAVAAIAKATS